MGVLDYSPRTPRTPRTPRKVWALVGDMFQQGEMDIDMKSKPSNDPKIMADVKLVSDKEIRTLSVNSSNIFDRGESECNKDDCCSLEKLNVATVLMNLANRYSQDQIYTYTSTVLLAVNPYKRLPHLYTDAVRSEYSKISSLHAKPPHPYALSDMAYRLLQKGKNQVIVISGESGAGKTETAKIIMECLADRSRTGKEKASDLQNKILQGANPVLESLGNATTVRNCNSSRFGKYNKLIFNPVGSLVGTEVLSYLLESTRAVTFDESERTYHVFYELLAGASNELLRLLKLNREGRYRLMYKGDSPRKNQRNDGQNFEAFARGLSLVGFTEEQQIEVFTFLAAFIHIGEIQFEAQNRDDEPCTLVGMDKFTLGSKLLCIDEDDFFAVLTERTYNIKQQGVSQNVSVLKSSAEALSTLQSFQKILYHRFFDYIIQVMNGNLARLNTDLTNHYSHIGILDIYGFETLNTNSFEQYCINFANEKLQAFFIENVIMAEQKVYETEGLNWQSYEVDSSNVIMTSMTEIMKQLDDHSKQ